MSSGWCGRRLGSGNISDDCDFPDSEAARIEELNTKAKEGILTPEEASELEAYVNIADSLTYWQSDARQVLRRPA